MMRDFRIASLGAVGWLAVYGPASAQTQPAPDMPATSPSANGQPSSILDTGQDAEQDLRSLDGFFDASGNSRHADLVDLDRRRAAA